VVVRGRKGGRTGEVDGCGEYVGIAIVVMQYDMLSIPNSGGLTSSAPKRFSQTTQTRNITTSTTVSGHTHLERATQTHTPRPLLSRAC
jgi:hypothetical protein